MVDKVKPIMMTMVTRIMIMMELVIAMEDMAPQITILMMKKIQTMMMMMKVRLIMLI